jgi:cytochrome c biogenesis protein ResB
LDQFKKPLSKKAWKRRSNSLTGGDLHHLESDPASAMVEFSHNVNRRKSRSVGYPPKKEFQLQTDLRAEQRSIMKMLQERDSMMCNAGISSKFKPRKMPDHSKRPNLPLLNDTPLTMQQPFNLRTEERAEYKKICA